MHKLQQFKIDGVKCNACINDILYDLKQNKHINSVDMNSDLNELYISSEKQFTAVQIQSYIKSQYKVLTKTNRKNITLKKINKIKKLYPLILIITYIFLSSILINIDDLNLNNLMLDYMGIFFIVFSFFKFLDLKGFKNSFMCYDIIAKKVSLYGYIYPFIEITISSFLLFRYNVDLALVITIIILSFTTFGVINTLRNKINTKCACLGSTFNLPMTEATLIENFIMIIMSLIMVAQ
ncbi:MAG: heavy metal transporter [Flavobacteriales bacterium]|nr:heavy metal transporter [Flavobacteriales bacterium]|tara:strand:- start:11988 stop:12698 length:711 start_codon:yes stop_codon:yes gene_type:complete